jgi:transcriptional regulator with XRE-family HTH domain
MLTSPIPALLEVVQSVIGAGGDTVPSNNALIGSRVRTRRIARGLSRQQMSRQLGIKGDELAAHEAGEKRINANLLFRIAKVLDVRPDYFFRSSSAEDSKAA